jgi:hypothetical protein
MRFLAGVLAKKCRENEVSEMTLPHSRTLVAVSRKSDEQILRVGIRFSPANAMLQS